MTTYRPIEKAMAPCPDHGTLVSFKSYWDSIRAKYTSTLHGYCPDCEDGRLKMTADGAISPRVIPEGHPSRTCHCGGTKRPNQTRCSACSDAARKDRQTETRTCAFESCGLEFDVVKPSAKRYCTTLCGTSAAKARRRDRIKAVGGRGDSGRKRAWAVDERFRIAYEHDYRCHICHELIDLSLEPNNRRALTLDHVSPLHPADPMVPPGLDERANLAPAHRGCNAAKGNR